ncbi:cell wall metabolism sensor histidine kinase WalK [Jeotgalibacillus sp. R-1-5s-1]|uniref:sensor histidine kinase n=1 Tax=Jeotgalibacillus sp. R-1-5s-1 TaxID=2555897 RepID=UPI00106BFE1F|nr:HAMP domain-containing histidine kinase [Jeotgalibacillus sp. R-1-5s-1]TFE03317.1 HAMP domain-containing histidine kinase [Jeotgalibacillus sp. R-1-5s-1]
MKKLKEKWLQLSIRWKWTFSAGASIFLSFSIFSVILIFAMSQWMLQEEENSVRSVVSDLEQFYQSRSPMITMNDIEDSRELAQQIYDQGQIITFYNEDGYELFTLQRRGEADISVPFVPVEDTVLSEERIDGRNLLLAAFPIESQGFNGYIYVIHPLDSYQSMVNYMIFLSIILGLGALLFSAVAAYFLAGKFIQPVTALGKTMKKTQQEGFQNQLMVPEVQDEVGGLIDIFNDMMKELEKNFLKQRQFAEDASHEMRTPLQIIEGHLALIQRWGKKDPEILEESLSISLQELERIKKLVNDLLLLSKADRDMIRENLTPLNPVDTIHDVCRKMKSIYKDRDIKCQAETAQIGIEKEHLEQVLIIFIDNALKYSPDGTPVTLTGEKAGDMYRLTIIDEGEGISEEHLPHIFDRFYRVDKSRSREAGGNGLGLSIAKRLLDMYKVGVAITSSSDGTKVRMEFPIYSKD